MSDLHSLMVLSFSSDPEAIIFSVGWHAVQRTVSVGGGEGGASLAMIHNIQHTDVQF